jgi:hypothetical protein
MSEPENVTLVVQNVKTSLGHAVKHIEDQIKKEKEG